MTSKEYLKKYKDLFEREEYFESKIKYCAEAMQHFYVQPNSYYYKERAKEKAEAEETIKEIKLEQKKIRDKVKQIDDDFLKDLIIYRYIDFLSWEDVTEALNIKHDPRSINNIKQYSHKRALEALQDIIDNKTMRQ